MMYGQVYMCSRYIDQLHCLARATLSNRLLAHFRTTASTYISKVSIYINMYQDTAGALWYNSFNIKGSSRPSAPGPLCTSVDGLRSMACDPIKWGEKWTKKNWGEKSGQNLWNPPLCESAVIHDGGEARRERRRKSVSSASEASRAISLSQDLCNSH